MGRTKNFNRDEILDKAVVLFWEKGYAETSASDLVNHLGLSRSSLYDTFGDKRKLYLETLQRYQQQVASQFEHLEAKYPHTRQLLQFLLESSIKQSQEGQDFKGCYMVNTTIEACPQDQEVWDIVQLNQHIFESNLTRMIQQDIDQGLLQPKSSPKSLAQFIFTSLSGFRIMIKSKTPSEDLQGVADLTLSVLD